MNKTYDAGLVRRLEDSQIQNMADSSRREIQGYLIIVTPAAGTAATSESTNLPVFTTRTRNDRSQWWKFWEHNQETESYIYYLVDLRDRKEQITGSYAILNSRYQIQVELTVYYQVDDPHTVALMVDDPLARLIEYLEDAVRVFLLQQKSFPAIRDVELLLNDMLSSTYQRHYERLGMKVFRIASQVTLPQAYYDDFDTYVEEKNREEAERKARAEEIRKRKEEKDYDVTISDIEARREEALREIELEKERLIAQIEQEHAADMEQINRLRDEIQLRETRRRTENEAEERRISHELNVLKKRLDAREKMLELKITRELELYEDATTYQKELHHDRHRTKLLEERIKSARTMLSAMGISPERHPWIAPAIAANFAVNREEGLMELKRLLTGIQQENRQAAQKAMAEFYDVIKPAIKNGYATTDDLRQFVDNVVPQLAGRDLAGYIESGSSRDDEDDPTTESETYTEPDTDIFDGTAWDDDNDALDDDNLDEAFDINAELDDVDFNMDSNDDDDDEYKNRRERLQSRDENDESENSENLSFQEDDPEAMSDDSANADAVIHDEPNAGLPETDDNTVDSESPDISGESDSLNLNVEDNMQDEEIDTLPDDEMTEFDDDMDEQKTLSNEG